MTRRTFIYSLDLREEISRLYGPGIGPDNILVFARAQ
eukprot:SAG22_NODE_16136_length_332_cov_0.669528_1_plen_36_part_10